jgi:hypothetical protein
MADARMMGRVLVAAFAIGAVCVVSAVVASRPAGANVSTARAAAIEGCRGPAVRPRNITLTCADAGFQLHRLRWSKWGAPIARARGTVRFNDCDPDCAGGHIHTGRASVRVSRLRHCAATGRDEDRRLVVFSRALRRRSHRITWSPGCGT